MSGKGDDEILQLFYDESKEHLDGIEEELLALERQGDSFDPDLVNSIFRSIHTIKGGCGFFGLDKLSKLSHSMESVLDRIRKKEMHCTSDVVGVILKGVDLLKTMIHTPESTDSLDIQPALDALAAVLSGSLSQTEKKSASETVDIKLSNGRVIFTVNKYDFERARKAEKGGNQIYLVQYDLVRDIERSGKTPWNVIAELLQLSVFIDSKVDIEGVGDLAEDTQQYNIPFYALIATVIETDLIYDFLGLDRTKVLLIGDDGAVLPEGSKRAVPVAAAAKPSASFASSQPQAPAPQAPPPPAPELAQVQPEHLEPSAPSEPAVSQTQSVKKDVSQDDASKKPSGDSSSIRVNVNLLDKLMSLAGELVLARNQLLQGVGTSDSEAVAGTSQRIDLITAELQEAIMATRMQSIGIVFHKFNRVVRDLARDLKKEVKLILEGEEVELDKSILESIGDPLTHLVRNSLDHGLETPEVRQAAGKSTTGTLKISAFHEAGHVIIKIVDDGGGIRIDKVKAKALQQGLYSREQLDSMSEKEIVKIIFKPGFSTAEKVTGLSGRGVGMDVVMTNLTKLGGTIDIDSKPGHGTTVAIKLPLTLAIIPSLLLAVGGERFAIPQVNLVELVRLSHKEASRIEKVGDAKVIRLRDRLLPLVRLSDVLADGRPIAATTSKRLAAKASKDGSVVNIAVVSAGDVHYGLIVDTLLDSSEIVVKPLGRHLKKCKAYAGATILGDGCVALIIDVVGICREMKLFNIGDGKESRDEASSAAATDGNLDERDKQSLLIVHNGNHEPFGIPLGLVARIEKIKSVDVEVTGGRKAIKYRGGTLPLFALEEVAKVTPREPAEHLVVVVFKVGGREVGLMLSEIVDIVETESKIDDATYSQPGIYGSAVINGRITLLVDLYGLVYSIMPHWKREVKSEVKPQGLKEGVKPTVLIAEDSRFFMTQIKSFMEDSGYEVVTAEDGLEAWKTLDANAEKVNIVLTDIEMPNMDGFEFTERLRHDDRFQALPVIAVTSIAGSEPEAKAKQVGLDEYLIKLDRDEILKKCSHYLKHGRSKE